MNALSRSTAGHSLLAIAVLGPGPCCRLGRRRPAAERPGAADQPGPPRLPGRQGGAAEAGGPHDVPAGSDRRSACSGPTPTSSRTAATSASAAGLRRSDGHLGQGAFNADDMARAAVVYLRHWKQTGPGQPDPRLRDAARPDLPADRLREERRQRRAVDAARRHAEPERGAGRAARPVGQRRVLLARSHDLGAGGGLRRVQERADPAFARFLQRRLDLAVDAVDRQVLDAYGALPRHRRRPYAGLADRRRRRRLGRGHPRPGGVRPRRRQRQGQARDGPAERGHRRSSPVATRARGRSAGCCPWALSRSIWHAWGSQMPAALARAADVTGDTSWRRAAERDSFTFDPWMLTSGGPDNGRLPARADATQIAYGVDSRVQSLLATGGSGPRGLAGIFAAWFFGANASRLRCTTRPPAAPSTASPRTAR